jgi:hypothetical protein
MKKASLLISALVCFQAGFAANIISVPAGGDFQSALNSAHSGDTVVLAAGATYTGNFVLPVNSGPNPITIQSSALASLPAGRVDKSQANYMPKIVTPNAYPAIQATAGASHYEFVGLEIYSAPGIYVQDLVRFGNGTETSLAQLPSDFTIDRCYIHGDLTGAGGKRGVTMNAGQITVQNSYMEGFWSNIQDSQNMGGWNGPGPYTITNNYLNGSTVMIGFGGAPVAISGLVPSNITITGNYFYRDPSTMSSGWWTKNHIELKNAQNVVIDKNVFDYVWSDAGITDDPNSQRGFAFVFTVGTEGGVVPWAIVNNVTVSNNIIRHAGGGINFTGHDPNGGGPSGNFIIKNNLWTDISTTWGYGYLMQILNGVQGITFDHNTAFQTGFFAGFDVGQSYNVTFTNNIAGPGMGIVGDDTGNGTATLNAYDPGWVFTDNVFVGVPAAQYPSGSYYPATIDAVGFVDYANGNYALSSSSPYHNMGTDLTDIGVNVAALPALPGAPQQTSGIPTGWLEVVSKNSGQCLDVISTPQTQNGMAPATPVQQWTCWGGPMQQWQFVAVSGGYEIVNQNSGQGLDMAGGPAATANVNGAALIQWPYWGGTNEIFSVVPAPDSGYYEIKPTNSSNECLDVISTSATNYATMPGTYVQQNACWGGPMQEWQLVPVQ